MPTEAALDLDALSVWLGDRGIDAAPDFASRVITGGRSNLTFLISGTSSGDLILRRPPLGSVLQSAHDVGREYRIMRALATSDVPVPGVIDLCEDTGVIGAPFYVTQFVSGRVYATHEEGGHMPSELRAQVCQDLVSVLGRIHAVDVDEVGLGLLGRRDDYLPRQLRRWHQQCHKSAVRAVPLIDDVHDALAARVPPQRDTGLVHGDYRFGNVLVNDDCDIAAVLDWELCTLGDPLADLGWLLATWHQRGEDELYQSPSGHAGYFTRNEVAGAYVGATGRDVSAIGYYTTFALWRLACIYEGIYQRYRAGVMADDGADVEEQGRIALRLVEAAHERVLEGDLG